jgi:DNA helicase-2/ATP-dependent DNA helicase PcrA
MAFDFDDLIAMPIRLFSECPDILKKYQARFRYILVDEYQDTNRAQYMLLHHLAKESRNLCVVGDDDQSIYRWRGADLRNIIEFEKDFPNYHLFRLEQNYRSTQTILQAANSVIENNKDRKGKTLWSDREKGDPVELMEVVDEREEAQKVVERIKEEVFKGKRSFHEFAVLYRTNAQSRSLEDGFRRSGMSYTIVGGVRFYERKEIKDVLAYLKLICNPRDSLSLKRIINFPLRGIGESTLRRIEAWALDNGLDLFQAIGEVEAIPDISSRIKKSVIAFHIMMQKYIELKDKITPNELVRTVVDETGLLTMYKGDTSVEGQGRAENIREFLSAVGEYVDSSESTSLSGFLEEVSLVSDIDSWNDKSNAITLMTLHCAKGLEFPVVFITGLEEGLFPVPRSLDEPEALEEERRLFYVGLTRAKDKIYVSWAERRRLFSDMNFRIPSRFLDEIDPAVVRKTKPARQQVRFERSQFHKKIVEQFDTHPEYESFSQEDTCFQKGARVHHEMFGNGTIVNMEGTGSKKKVVVQFENGVKKKFLLQYARFDSL